jgi:hypothetical protein
MAQTTGQVSADGRWVWSGTQWVPNQKSWARPYESARFRATMATIFLGANAVGILLLIGFDLMVIAGGGSIGSGTDAQVLVEGAIALVAIVVYVGSFIPAVVFFCMWNHRVVRNMPALGSPDPRWSPAGAVGRCFIPFLNLIHPLRSVLDAWRGADPATRWTYLQTRVALGTPTVISGWWAAWLIGAWISNIGGRLTNGSDASLVVSGAWISILGSVVLIGSAWLAILVVREVTSRQDQKNELITTGRLV